MVSDCVAPSLSNLIAAVLREHPNAGLFKREVTKPNGEAFTFRFSWAIGMSSLHAEHRYRKRFGKSLPAWTQFVHPWHMTQVCNLAMVRDSELPPEIHAAILNAAVGAPNEKTAPLPHDQPSSGQLVRRRWP